jgi:spermidine synthase
MQDSRDNIIALAYENLDNAEEYPDPRIIIHFGDNIDTVENMFAKRDVVLKYLE